jgi:hypothetical protein
MLPTPKLISKFMNGMGNADGMSSMAKGIVGWGALSTATNMAQGDDFGKAALKGTVDAVLWTNYAPAMWGYQLATGIPAAGQAAYTWYNQQKQWWNINHLQGSVGGGYHDTQKALTMRQAAVQAIQGSKLNARSALGGEAQILNQNWTRT